MTDRLASLKTFLPGLEGLLDDPEVTEIMINGPANVWIERAGAGLEQVEAPLLDEGALRRAAISIARPLGLDPKTDPALDARLADGSRVAIATPPAAPHVAITIRRFGERSFSAEQLLENGTLTPAILEAARDALRSRRNILVSGGTGSGKTTLLNALIELLPHHERIVSIEDTLELRIDQANTVRFEARDLGEGSLTIRALVRHSLRHRPDHIVVGEVRGQEAADLLQALNTGHGGSLTTVHANNARAALSRLASCAMQAGELPWEVVCRSVVDGISLVLHMTRVQGRRYVEEAIAVQGWNADDETWLIDPIASRPTAVPAALPAAEASPAAKRKRPKASKAAS
ncbi:MAG: ATPase, T2SS/T4P/T4SS family [Chloroflexi bacterium]|nr:ATPase, T2SS/T4P/T4SS family [Chloroflexota bacterium]